MTSNFILPVNLAQLKNLADTFLMAVESANEKGMLTSTFQHNATMKGFNIPHGVAIIAEEIAHQTEQSLIERELAGCVSNGQMRLFESN